MDIEITPTGNATVDTLLALAKMAVYPGAVAAVFGAAYGVRALARRVQA